MLVRSCRRAPAPASERPSGLPAPLPPSAGLPGREPEARRVYSSTGIRCLAALLLSRCSKISNNMFVSRRYIRLLASSQSRAGVRQRNTALPYLSRPLPSQKMAHFASSWIFFPAKIQQTPNFFLDIRRQMLNEPSEGCHFSLSYIGCPSF